MPACTINLVFSCGVGPVNFPMYDCKAADAAGITVRAVGHGNNNGFIDFLFCDDTNLDPNFSMPIRNPIGNNSASGAHKWGTAGTSTGVLSVDTKTVNSYAVGLLAQGHAYNVAYNGSGCVVISATVLVQPLPVELVRFGATLQKGRVHVGWETASEHDCAYFVVERSANGREFATVGEVPGSGTSTQKRAYTSTLTRRRWPAVVLPLAAGGLQRQRAPEPCRSRAKQGSGRSHSLPQPRHYRGNPALCPAPGGPG